MNHSVRSDDWRYIRYADGGEELYHNEKDPLEYTNLAGDPAFVSKKEELAKFLPELNAADLPSDGNSNGGGKNRKKKGKAEE